MKKLVLPIAILAMSILPILTALTNTDKVRRQRPSGFQREVVAPSTVCTLTEGFDDISNLVGMGWFMQNNSMPIGGTGWFQGNPTMFTSQMGAPNSYIAADFNNGSGDATISNWLMTPTLLLQNGGVMSFWTRTATPGAQLFPDRLQVRMSTNGTSTDVGNTATSVGDFTTLLLDINSTYADDYPHVWTQYTVTISGLPSSTTGRLAFRYFVEDGGPSGSRSNYIGIDTMAYACPSPTPNPTPTLGNYPATSIPLSTDATVTPDATPTNAARINVSTSTNFKGRLEGYPATGVVRITDAHPAGTYPVTVKAFAIGGASVTKIFTLTVTTPATCYPVSFAAVTNFGVGTGPNSVAVGDFNGDGNQDLAMANANSNNVSVLLGDGAGGFGPATNFGVGVKSFLSHGG
ncbi:MAG: choice-of-anchor J domain-containing protein [Chthoniobacterales bacterium]